MKHKQNTHLNGSAHGDGLIGIDALERLLAEEGLANLLDLFIRYGKYTEICLHLRCNHIIHILSTLENKYAASICV